ncbi:PACE efflux transporter [Variovorax sp. J22R133]|uniref:PACE efflux transporter n=1 Tax=Variovorax brevis TaxID=3053503 RepID=UPI002575C981|nr:PACE efflux transporter [Variovorax sp. J22R133]MDM0111594.1 PACE efflux transporter [Variovorax sp. J22R133]
MQGIKRKVIYISLYEGLAIVAASAGLSLMSGEGLDKSGPLAIASSVVAILWNLGFNTLFERWESTQATKGRSLMRRIVHAIGFEGGLAAILVPLFAWVLKVSLFEALVMDLGLLLFFLVYTFAFNWGFDRVFGLPRSAMASTQPA